MKKSDLGIVMIHWMLVAVLLGTTATGIFLWKKEWQAPAAWLFVPENMGVIHISLSVAVVVIVLLHWAYLKHKNFFSSNLSLRASWSWKSINIMLYWALFTVIWLETATGVLLTKLIDQPTLARIFGIERHPLLLVHLYLVLPILAFPFAHAMIHWLDGKVLSIFRPRVFSRRPSMSEVMSSLKAENVRLKKSSGESLK